MTFQSNEDILVDFTRERIQAIKYEINRAGYIRVETKSKLLELSFKLHKEIDELETYN